MTELMNVLDTDQDPRPDSPPAAVDRLSILALDDDPGIRNFYRQGLEQIGNEVVAVESGRKALQVIMQNRFDVMIVDIQMPEMNGVVFLREALKVWPWVGVVVVSGFAQANVVDKLSALGVTRILHKPVALETLRKNVVAAAAECPKPATLLPCAPLMTLVKGHLKMFSRAEGTRMDTAGSLADTLDGFMRDLAVVLPCDMLGMLVAEADRPVFLAHLCRPVSPDFVDSVRAELLSRYQVISGHALPPSVLEQRIAGAKPSAADAVDIGQILSVPVILGDDVCAMLTLATRNRTPYRPSDVSLLYLAANHVGAVVLALRKMQTLAIRDGLTGLFNRLRIEEDLARTWKASRRNGTSMAIVVLDLDHFKVMNDSYGHAVGDRVLCDFAKLMQSSARASDLLGRFGGDEFVIILPQTALPEARAFCERLLQQTRAQLFCAETHRLSLTVSMGMTLCDPHAVYANPADLLSQADRALYQAKRNGRDRVCVWDGDGGLVAVDDSADSERLTQRKARAQVLLVDDDPTVLHVLCALLTEKGFETDTANSAVDAIARIKRSPGHYDIVMTDLVMPEVSGVDLLKQVAHIDNLIVPLVMTGYAHVENAIACLREGATDLLLKPIEPQHLYASMRRAMALRSLKLDNVNHQRHLENMVAQRSRQLQQMLEDVKDSYAFTLEAFMAILDAREQQTGRHSLRVRELAIWLARRMEVHGVDLEAIATGALLHDIGKIGIPDRILLSPDALSPEARQIMQDHANIGAKILSGSPRLADAARIVAEHHECFDGSGYPKGLQGEAICLGARIFAVADTYDAMRSDRPYRQALSETETVREILANRGTQFDPAVVNVFVENRESCEQLFQQLNDDPSLSPTVITEAVHGQFA